VERTVAAIVAEIERSPWRGRPASTIFFGGGTPTFLGEGQLLAIFETVLRSHPPLPDCEITSEANPGTVDASKFGSMRRAGFNRVSLGAQSFLDTDLIALGRIHRVGEIERAVGAARGAGFENLNLDLMFALPDQSLHAWNRNLDRALGLNPEHLSLYCLTLEPNTPFYKRHLAGDLVVPDEDAQVEMYDACLERMAEAGFEQYEISNFAKPGRACRHNLAYWTGLEYAGYGPGAVGCVESEGVRRRYTNLKLPTRYAGAVEAGDDAWYEEELLGPAELRMEAIMLGLRLNEGVCVGTVGLDPSGLERVLGAGWGEEADGRLRLTPAGRHFCSEVAMALV
ncbi:MAG TPA: radical SAM family heme chaperone HemW, partial [Fimbriimonadaceae bacterium]|nr:radical SAM family heme chaperone HemW [Fimbriimonadaceae bacterium]